MLAVVYVASVAFARSAAAGEIIRPCRPGTPAHVAAGAALAVLDADIRRLAPGADPQALAKRLEALGDQSCFRVVGGLSADAKSGLSLRTWWQDGGYALASGALALGGDKPIVWVAPDVRRALTLEAAPEHRLTPLLCPSADKTCGRDTDGWRLRAEASLKRAASARTQQDDRSGEILAEWKGKQAPVSDDCDSYARKGPRLRQLARYRRCLDVTAARTPAFAIGHVRKPIEGWLVVSGRRGHYSFCDEQRAFDLSTGSAYRVASCSGLALGSGGGVNHRATDAARKRVRERGTVSLDEIREAAWMLLHLGELDDHVLTESFGKALPKGISLEGDGVDTLSGRIVGSLTVSSNQTPLSWKVTVGTRELGSGIITWPRDLNDDTEAYATELLEVAEASFTAGCPPATPPAALIGLGDKLSASHLDTDAKSLRDAGSALDASWRELLFERCTSR